MVTLLKKRTPRKKVKAALKKAKARPLKTFDAKRFKGALPMEGDPVAEQRKLRDEWT